MDDQPCMNLVNCEDWNIEEIPESDYVMRQVTHMQRSPLDKKRRYPNESAFKIDDDEDGLSVNWSKYLTPRENFIIIATSFNRKQVFLDYLGFRLFKLPVKFLNDLRGVDKVVHDPICRNPAPVGRPNNRAHALVKYLNNNDSRLRMNLSDYCRNNHAESYVDFDVKSINEEIKELRNRISN